MSTVTPSSTTHTSHRVARCRRSLLGVRVAGTGSYAPENIVRNEDLASLGCDPEWIVQRTGIRERRHAPPEMATSDMAIQAAQASLQSAKMTGEDIDLLICCTVSPDYPTPTTACLVQAALGARGAAVDLNAACSGFIYGFMMAAQFAYLGTYERILVIGADIMSRYANPKDKRTFPLFGDGAGAVVVTADPNGVPSGQGIRSFRLGADGSLGHHLVIPAGGSREPISHESLEEDRQFLVMDGQPVFKWAVRQISDAIHEILQDSKITIHDVDLLILHQANVRIIDTAVEHLGISRDRVFVNLDKYGNTAAGSIPLALDEACKQGRIRHGDRILMCGFGAGLTWGACLIQW
jgi:3-oxoacyl-[acyl-carrier-protein] synthase III